MIPLATALLHGLAYLRLDALAFLIFAVGGCLGCRSYLRRRRAVGDFSLTACWMVIAIGLGGILAAEWAGAASRNSLRRNLAALAPTYLYELQKLGHASLTTGLSAEDPALTAITRTVRDWRRLHPDLGRLLTYRVDENDRVRVIVDDAGNQPPGGILDGAPASFISAFR